MCHTIIDLESVYVLHLLVIIAESHCHHYLGASNTTTDVSISREAASKGVKVIIAAAGDATHLPGMIAAI